MHWSRSAPVRRSSSPSAWTRVDEATLRYEYTVDDPTTFARSFTVALPMKRSGDDIFEYACHEGNYGMANLLSGARAAEIAAR